MALNWDDSMNRILLVTGGSRGIGAEVARRAGQAGYSVVINYHRDRVAAERVKTELESFGAEAVVAQADVAEPEQVEAMFDDLDRLPGSLHALVNSAGIDGNLSPATDFDARHLQRLFAVNVLGTMFCCQQAVRRMTSRNGGAGGAIVNVSSMAATIGGRAYASDYAASKAAVDSFTVGLAREVGEQGIRANSVRPGMTLTDMSSDLRDDESLQRRIAATIGMNRIATADEVAAPILWLLSEQASFISGACLDVSGGGFVIGNRTRSGGNGTPAP